MLSLRYLHFTVWMFLYFPTIFASSLVSTESDPDAFIQNCVNVINGDYCESATDLVIAGPDALTLQRFYSTKDPITGKLQGGWRILPQRFLVIGKEQSSKTCMVGKERYEWSLAYVGERSGSILPYHGWRNTTSGLTKDPLKIDVYNHAKGMVNTYCVEMNGQNNHQNNQLHCKGDACEVVLGDGTKRIYKKVIGLPTKLFGEELTPLMTSQIVEPSFFHLDQEILPSGNQIFFSYDDQGQLIKMEMTNRNGNKTLSWIHFSYDFQEVGCLVHLESSDSREINYSFVLDNELYQLTKVQGSHCIPVHYEYNEALCKKCLPEGRFVEIEYHEGRVKSLKGPNAQSGQSEVFYSFSYESDCTDVLDALGAKSKYLYDKRFQLTAIEQYDEQNKLYRIDKRFWGKTPADAGLLLAKTIEDGCAHFHSYRSFHYDKAGNILEEKLYGNLTGKQEASLRVTLDGELLNPDEEERHVKTFGYSSDGLNLLTKFGDSKGNQTQYRYKTGTNLLTKKFIYEKGSIKKRTFQTYNDDGVCVKVIEDDGSQEEENKFYGYSVSERHVQEIVPKETLPGVGLPENIKEIAIDIKKKQEVLVKKLAFTYDDQANRLTCSTFDANDNYAFTEKKTYNKLGFVTSETDAIGGEVVYNFDDIGNRTSISFPKENKSIVTTYDFNDQPVQIVETNPEGQSTTINQYDCVGRKTCSIDRFGNSTNYKYDIFGRLRTISFPEVLDENDRLTRPTFNYTYDILGNVLTIEDPKGFITEKFYNLRGDPTRINYSDKSSEFFKYDTEGSLHRSLTRDQIITVYEYDYLGRLIYQESSTANEKGVASYLSGKSFKYNGFRCTYEKEDFYVRQYYYDPAGRLASIVEYDAGQGEKGLDSRSVEYFYDLLGRLHQKRVWFGFGKDDYAVECSEHDLIGNVVEKRIENAQGVILLRKGFSYNGQGLCEEEYLLDDNKTSLVKTFYNFGGEQIGCSDGLSNETKIITDHAHRNKFGQRVLKKTIVNPIGVQTEIEFDALSRVHTISKKDPLGTLLSSQKVIYDALGNKSLEIHDRIVDGKVIDACKTQWLYGPMGRLEMELEGVGTPLEKRIQFDYNSLGQLSSKIISGIETPIKYTYDKYGKLAKIEAQNDKKELLISNRYSHDRKGNILSASSLNGKTVNRTYNVFNQVNTETITDGEGSYTLKYTYDRKGRVKEISLPDQSKIAYLYDAVFGREVQRISPNGEILYNHTYDQYDCQGRLLSETHMGYVGTSEYTYDLNSQKILNKNDYFSEEYKRDSIGRLTEVKGDKNEKYAYNSLSQLTSEKSGKAYAYDSLDNRIKINQDELIYNTLNQLTSCSKANFSYDLNGNLLKKILDGEETRYESNILSQLVTIEKSHQPAVTFSYDALGRLLVEKQIDLKEKNKKTLSTTRYFYLGFQEIGTLTPKGMIETLKVPGLNGDALSCRSVVFEIKNQQYVPLHDDAGNVFKLINPQNREIIESYEYTAFGEETIYNANGKVEKNSLVGNPWRFAEKRYNQKVGLIFFGQRFYDPSTGRWITQDPLGYIDGPNLYAYLHNNPLNHIDRFGLSTESPILKQFQDYFFGEVESHCYCETHRTCKRGGDIGKTVASALPKITYYDNFEKYHPNYPPSRIYNLSADKLPNLPPNLGIGFINGVWNDQKSARESARYVSRLAGGYNIHAVYNATHGYMVDIIECDYGLRYVATPPVRQLHKMWNSFFDKNSADAKFLMICHSQGAIHVRNALLDYPPELRERILIVAIAPGGYIYQVTCAQVIHYRAPKDKDFIPRKFDKEGAEREKNSIVDLESHKGVGRFDHEFISLTYKESLRKHIDKYIESQGKEI